jgi:hypothetical protein
MKKEKKDKRDRRDRKRMKWVRHPDLVGVYFSATVRPQFFCPLDQRFKTARIEHKVSNPLPLDAPQTEGQAGRFERLELKDSDGKPKRPPGTAADTLAIPDQEPEAYQPTLHTRYVARLSLGGKTFNVGKTFDNDVDAAYAYDDAVYWTKEWHVEPRPMNDPDRYADEGSLPPKLRSTRDLLAKVEAVLGALHEYEVKRVEYHLGAAYDKLVGFIRNGGVHPDKAQLASVLVQCVAMLMEFNGSADLEGVPRQGRTAFTADGLHGGTYHLGKLAEAFCVDAEGNIDTNPPQEP